ncbi:unnamed protein product, partial [Cyprideis torosa]
MQMMKNKIPLQAVLVCLWISGLLSIEITKYQKFPGFACNTTIGSPTSGLKDTPCLVKAHQNLCWAARTKPDCVCCQTVRPDNTTFLYAHASCPSAFEFNSEFGKCYFFSNNTKSWYAAEDHCASLRKGVLLASIHSASEMNYLLS